MTRPGLTPVTSMTFSGCSMLSREELQYWASLASVMKKSEAANVKADLFVMVIA